MRSINDIQKIIDDVMNAGYEKEIPEEYRIREECLGPQAWHFGKWHLINILAKIYEVDPEDVHIKFNR